VREGHPGPAGGQARTPDLRIGRFVPRIAVDIGGAGFNRALARGVGPEPVVRTLRAVQLDDGVVELHFVVVDPTTWNPELVAVKLAIGIECRVTGVGTSTVLRPRAGVLDPRVVGRVVDAVRGGDDGRRGNQGSCAADIRVRE